MFCYRQKLNGQRPTLSDDELADGMMQKNQPKNRDPDILPGMCRIAKVKNALCKNFNKSDCDDCTQF